MVALFLWVQHLNNLRKDETGATAVEYGLLVGLIAVAIIVTVTLLGSKLNSLFSSIAGSLPTS